MLEIKKKLNDIYETMNKLNDASLKFEKTPKKVNENGIISQYIIITIIIYLSYYLIKFN